MADGETHVEPVEIAFENEAIVYFTRASASGPFKLKMSIGEGAARALTNRSVTAAIAEIERVLCDPCAWVPAKVTAVDDTGGFSTAEHGTFAADEEGVTWKAAAGKDKAPKMGENGGGSTALATTVAAAGEAGGMVGRARAAMEALKPSADPLLVAEQVARSGVDPSDEAAFRTEYSQAYADALKKAKVDPAAAKLAQMIAELEADEEAMEAAVARVSSAQQEMEKAQAKLGASQKRLGKLLDEVEARPPKKRRG